MRQISADNLAWSARQAAADMNQSHNGGTFLNPTNARMGIELERLNEVAVINLSGRLDLNTSPNLHKTALKLYTKRKCKSLTIDFGNVSYIDTSGLATLIEILVKAKEEGAQLTLRGLNEKVRYLIDVNGLTGFFSIEGSEREKLSA